HYKVIVMDDNYADLVISLVVALDYVEMMESTSS
ncbi:UDP-N-acetylenolpyruvoylglucosamine reductase, partial [Streptococcus ruminantium]|nr:UDP-N-acetylenolpyruvoylglucosamine reductase [Streptococcus ruminantium]